MRPRVLKVITLSAAATPARWLICARVLGLNRLFGPSFHVCEPHFHTHLPR